MDYGGATSNHPKKSARTWIVAASAIALLLLVGQISMQANPPVMAIEGCEPRDDNRPKEGDRISLRDIGVLQLADHDLYNVDRTTSTDSEDERLNLSTLFNHGDDPETIINGGDPRNSNNVIVHNIASRLGEMYVNLIEDGNTEEEAYEMVHTKYMRMVERAFENLFPIDFPAPATGDETEESPEERQEGNVALRTLHVILPGKISINGEERSIEDISPFEHLTSRELDQLGRRVDDSYDKVFLDLDLIGSPVQSINLLERDRTFAEEFTDLDFDEMLCELADGRYNRGDIAMQLLKGEFAEAQAPEEE
jgi:hypothetical protein